MITIDYGGVVLGDERENGRDFVIELPFARSYAENPRSI
jgi:hypothetical protein